MFMTKRLLAMVLSITLIICSTLPSLAQENNVQESTVDGKIVEQLKSDLGVEKAEEILGKKSFEDSNDLTSVVSNDEVFGESDEILTVTSESSNESSQLEKTYDSNDELEDDLVQTEIEDEPEEDESEIQIEEEQEKDESLTDEESVENADSTDSESVEENTNSNKEESENSTTVTEESEASEVGEVGEVSEEISDTSARDSQNSLGEDNVVKSDSNENTNNNENVSDSSIGSDITSENITIKVDNNDAKVNNTEEVENNDTSNDSNNETNTTDHATETITTAESNIELNSENIVATESEVKESLDDVEGLVATISDIGAQVATDSEALYGVETPWMWWYLTDEGHAIHYTSTEPASGGHGVSYTYIDYSSINKEDITRAVFDDVVNAQTTCLLFYGFTNLTEIDGISNLNTDSVTNMGSMFNGCSSLTSIDVSNFNTNNVTNMSSMFSGCSSLTSIDVSNFNTNNVTDMRLMFDGCSSLTTLDVSNFDTSNVIDMSFMFRCSEFDNNFQETISSLQQIVGLENFDTSNVVDMGSMFWGCISLNSLDVSHFNTSSTTKLDRMFWDCSSLTSIDVSNFNTSNVTDMSYMFYGCSSLVSIDVSNFDTSNVTDMSYMFACYTYDYSTSEYQSSLTSIEGLEQFDTRSVRNMSFMFSGCINLASLDVSSFDTSNVTSASNQQGMYGMFMNCKSLQSIDLSSFNTQNVRIFQYMFGYCENLTELNLSNFNTSSGVDFRYMFNGCYSLETLDISNFDLSNSTNNDSMIARCGSIRTLKISESVANIINDSCKISYDWQKQGEAAIYQYDNINNKTTFPNFAGTYIRVNDTNRATVTFDSRGGSFIYAQTVNVGNTINAPTAPTKDNSLFLGWYDETLTNQFDFTTSINSNMTLYAKWQDVEIITTYWYIENGTDLHLSSTEPTSASYVAGQSFKGTSKKPLIL